LRIEVMAGMTGQFIIAARRNGARAGAFALALALALAGLLAGDALAIAGGERMAGAPASAVWREVKWPFPIDQWGTGRAFRCSAADCGIDITLYLRAKLGFCNCTTGVSDDTELDRVGDLELLSEKFDGLRDGRPIAVGWMHGRSRPYRVAMASAPPRSALAIAFNDKCDVVVATVVAAEVDAAERAALAFLNGDLVLRWAERELGL
jgi:hypothetical protein